MDRSIHQLSAEGRLHLFLDAACDYGIFFANSDMEICEWSAGAEKILGHTKEEALGLNGRMIFTPEDREAGVPEREMVEARERGQADDERWHLRKDGARFFAVGRLVALKDDGGNLYGFVKILRDMTHQKRTEQALRASEEQFRATFAQAPLGMVLTDLEGKIQRTNAAFQQLTGFGETELAGRDLASLTAPEDRDHVRGLFDELISGKRNGASVEKRMLRADGSRVWVQNSGALLRDPEGSPLSFIDLCQDISVLKMSAAELGRLVERRTEELVDKAKQMEAFCYTISHDLRAPLRAIAGYAEFLREDYSALLPAAGVESIERIEASAARLDRLICDLLSYTRVQQGPVIREAVDLTQVAEQVIWNVKREHAGENLSIELVSPLGVVDAHAASMEHVFLNLVSNAVKFRRKDAAPSVRIYSEESPGRLRVWIEDNGLGVEPRFRERVFGMFERLHSERKIPGTGVGLAIVSTVMERLGGSRGVEANHPHGSRFWIEFRK